MSAEELAERKHELSAKEKVCYNGLCVYALAHTQSSRAVAVIETASRPCNEHDTCMHKINEYLRAQIFVSVSVFSFCPANFGACDGNRRSRNAVAGGEDKHR